MNTETELVMLRHIVETYGHLDFDDIKNNADMMDCVMMEHGIRDEENWVVRQYSNKEMKRRHYMFRAFFDKENLWWNWWVEDMGADPVGVKKEFDLETELNNNK